MSPGHGTSAQDFVEVYDEPVHVCRLANEFVYAYSVELPPSTSTLWHRHTQDTIYFSLVATDVKEELPSTQATVTSIPCGAAISRPHFSEPLIHRVTNISSGGFHMIGAEARRRPPQEPRPLDAPGCTLTLETPRFRVYRVCPEPGTTTPILGAAQWGLLLATAKCELCFAADETAIQLPTGEMRWVTPSDRVEFLSGFDGFFAQWR